MKTVKKGYALATILILLGVSMFGAAALVSISILDSKISRSQQEGTSAYYVAEAGLQDGIWRLNNSATYKAALANNTLNVTYSSPANTPASGQSFTVTLDSTADHQGVITVTGQSDNGSFVAKRKVEATIFQGPSTGSATSGNVFVAGGGSLSITNGSGGINMNGGGLYAAGAIVINSATVNLGSNWINTPSTFSKNPAAVVNSAGIHASNFPPASAVLTVPGFDFTAYQNMTTASCTSGAYAAQTYLRCTPAQFQTLVSSGNVNFTNNRVVFIDNNLSFGNWAKNKSITVNGMFIVKGTMSINGSTSGFNFLVNDPGDGKSGIFTQGNITNGNGNWTVNGAYYTSGNVTFTNSQGVNINGALIAAGSATINTGLNLNLTYNETRVNAVFGGGTPAAVQVSHWEEEY